MEQNMTKQQKRFEHRELLGLPHYTLSEEVWNAISHGLGAVFAVIALTLLLLRGSHDLLTLTSVWVYGGTMFLLYTVSTLYHALDVCKAKKVFQILDHCTIYLLIAGTYTPITVLCMGGTIGIVLLVIVWSVALFGILLNAINMKRFKVLSMVCYIGLGWLVIFFLKPLIQNLDSTSLIYLVTGGVLYTVGAILYGKGKRVKYMHAIWHLFCVGGSFFHFLVIYNIVVK